MTQTEHPTMMQAEHRSGGLTLFLAFVGGALVGGAAAVLLAPRSGAETRRRIGGAVGDAKEFAARMPQAVRAATSAAQAAFAAALEESAGGNAAAPSQTGPRHHS